MHLRTRSQLQQKEALIVHKCRRLRRRVGRTMHLPMCQAVVSNLVVIEEMLITTRHGVSLKIMCLHNFVPISRIALVADIADIASNTRPRPSRETKDREDHLVTVEVRTVLTEHLGTLLPIRRVRVHALRIVVTILLLNISLIISIRRAEEEGNEICQSLHHLVIAILDPYLIYCCWKFLLLVMLLYHLAEILLDLRTVAAGDVFSRVECSVVSYFPAFSALLIACLLISRILKLSI